MNPIIDIGLAAVLTKSVVDELKKNGWVKSGFLTVMVSFAVNFVILLALGLADAAASGQTIDGVFVRSMVATVLAALYHDFRLGLGVEKRAK